MHDTRAPAVFGNMQDARVCRGVRSLALQLGITFKASEDTFALLQAIADHCGHSLAADGSVGRFVTKEINREGRHLEVMSCSARLSCLGLWGR